MLTSQCLCDSLYCLWILFVAASSAGSVKGTTASWDSLLAAAVGMPGIYGQARIFADTDGGSRFWFKNAVAGARTNFSINQAQILQPDNDAVDGVYHIISDVLNAPGYSNTIRHFLPLNSSLSTSNSLWLQLVAADPNQEKWVDLSAYSGSTQLYATLFVPDNNAWTSIPQTVFNNITGMQSLLKSVLGYHYAPNQLLFVNPALPSSTIPFYSGFPVGILQPLGKSGNLSDAKISILSNGNMFVTSGRVTARIIQANIPILQAVVHIIDRPLGVVYQTKRAILNNKAPVFLKMCDAIPECSALVNSTSIQTVFAFNKGDKLQASTQLDTLSYLRIHFLTTAIYMVGMKNYTKVLTFNNSGSIRFRNLLNGTVYVEGRVNNSAYGQTTLVDFDNAATDGIVHIVDSVIGYPVSDIQSFLKSDGRYSTFLGYDLYGALQNEFVSYGVTYTYFIPTNDALARMANDSSNNGSTLLQNNVTRNMIFRRSIIPNYVVLDDLTPGIKYLAATANYGWNKEQITLQVATTGSTTVATLTGNGSQVTVDAFDGGYRTQENDIIYPLSTSLYSGSDLYTQACNYTWCAATVPAASPLYLVLVIAVVQLLMNRLR